MTLLLSIPISLLLCTSHLRRLPAPYSMKWQMRTAALDHNSPLVIAYIKGHLMMCILKWNGDPLTSAVHEGSVGKPQQDCSGARRHQATGGTMTLLAKHENDDNNDRMVKHRRRGSLEGKQGSSSFMVKTELW